MVASRAVPKTEWAVDEMRTLRSDLDDRLDDFARTVGQRIDLLSEETRGLLRDEFQSEIGELRSEIGEGRRRLRLLLVAIILALAGVVASLVVQLL